jgi:hypothetical protein
MSETTTVCKCGHVEEAHEVDGCNHCYCGNFWAVRGVPPAPDAPTDEDVARAFHEAYERLASTFDYATREASAKPWADVPEANRRLMVATVAEVRALLAAGTPQPTDDERNEAQRFADEIIDLVPFGPSLDRVKIATYIARKLHEARAVVPPPPDTAAAPTTADTLREIADGLSRLVRTYYTPSLMMGADEMANGVADYALQINRLLVLRAPAPATDDAPTAEEVAAHFEARGLVSTAQTIRNFVRDHASPRATAPTPTED